MSDFALDDELVQEYIAESREHLATIENDLLAIEKAGADIDEQLVNRVFRAAHSIKGGAGFFDLVRIRELAHKTENVLDLVRSRQLVPTPAMVGVLFLAFDKLRELINNHRESNEADIADFLSTLTDAAAGPPDAAGPATPPAVPLRMPAEDARLLVRASGFDVEQARRVGNSIFIVECDLLHDVERRGRTPLALFEGMMRCGSVLDTGFDVAGCGTLDDEIRNRFVLEILYATLLDAVSIGQVFEIPLGHIRLIEDNRVAAVRAPEMTARLESAPRAAAVASEPPANAEVRPKVSAAGPMLTTGEGTIRLNIGLLDSLMTLAGELVLGRNQLNDAVASGDARAIGAGAHRISAVTSELQEAVALTRMQPVGSLFSKFPRLVRDLAQELGKQVELTMEGTEVEIDKSLLEGLSDPLTHMVRNAVDHGIETPAIRSAAGKPAIGSLLLRARHQAGQVVIEIKDDGKGLAAEKIAASAVVKGLVTAEQVASMTEAGKFGLIFHPGVSTAEKLSDVSGRGVGMDVVKTNLDKLGGKIDIESRPGQETTFRIKLPLTLAIIPSLLISDAGERFAIPQTSVGELIRIPAGQLAKRTDRAGDAEVLLLRDRLVPLLHLSEAMGYGRRDGATMALNVVLVDTGSFEFGLIVEELHETVEIVVKPLGRHFQGLRDYAGATILGDGRVAVILDVAGLAARAGMKGMDLQSTVPGSKENDVVQLHSLLLFRNVPAEICALPTESVTRVERVNPAQIEVLGGRRTMKYRDATLRLVSLSDLAPVGELSEASQWVVIVIERAGRPFGVLAAEPLEMVEVEVALDTITLRQTGIAGSAVLNGQTTLMLDIFELASSALGEETEADPVRRMEGSAAACGTAPTILVAEDSDFFRGQISRLIEAVGYNVLAAEDGQAAWEILDRRAGEISVVATDVEMPRLDGLALTRRIRADGRFANLPIIALSSLAGEEEVARGLACGVSEYQVKLDRDQLVASIQRAVGKADSRLSALLN